MESASSCCLGSRRSRWGFLPEQPEGTTKRLLDEHSQFMVANKVTANTLRTWPWCLEAHITKVHLKASLYHLRQEADFLELFANPLSHKQDGQVSTAVVAESCSSFRSLNFILGQCAAFLLAKDLNPFVASDLPKWNLSDSGSRTSL